MVDTVSMVEFNKLKRSLRELCDSVDKALEAIDQEFKKPASFERGQRIGRICNILELQNDKIKHFTLGLAWIKDVPNKYTKKLKPKGE